MGYPTGYLNFRDNFDAVGKGTGDNSAALNKFSAYARAESAAGRGVLLHVPSGTYTFDHSKCQGFLYNIKKLRIFGDGATFQNTYDPGKGGANFNHELPWGPSARGDLRTSNGKLIATATPGQSAVTLLTPSDAAAFAVGQWALIASLDTQFYGYPPNPDRFEYVEITAIDRGVISFAGQKLRYEHRDDFPDGADAMKCGKARIFQINTDWDTGAHQDWDVEHSFEGLEIRANPKASFSYFIISGRTIRFHNCTLPGVAPSIAGTVSFTGSTKILGGSEPDKLVDACVFDGVEISDLGFQSSSINRATVRNSRVHGTLNPGAVKSFYAENTVADTVTEAPTYGLNRSTTLVNVTARAATAFALGGAGATVDGVRAAYASGVFRIVKADAALWGVVPGASIRFLLANGFTGGNAATGIVTGVTEDATHIIVKTTLPYVTLPTWTSGEVRLQRSGRVVALNCGGCDVLRMASEATTAGRQPWEFARYLWAGVTPKDGYWFGTMVGRPLRFRVTVTQPAAIAGATLHFVHYNVPRASDFGDPQTYEATVDLTSAGPHDLPIPADRWFDGGSFYWSLNYAPSNVLATALPVFEAQFEFDAGGFRNISGATC